MSFKVLICDLQSYGQELAIPMGNDIWLCIQVALDGHGFPVSREESIQWY